MKKPFPVFLIDLDSVLVEPRGYRLAMQSALGWFTERMGLGDLYPGEDAIAAFEAINMTCEWDIVSVLLAYVFDGLVKEHPELDLPADLLAACDAVLDRHLDPPEMELEALTALLGSQFKPGMQYADLALQLNQSPNGSRPFPQLGGHALLANILGGTRDLEGSLTTRVFQHFTLGSKRFEQLSGFKKMFESESFLLKYDQVLLKDETRRTLLNAWRAGSIGAVIYTARPSLPEEGEAPNYNFSPEAEVAREAVRLTELPLIGAGKMGWLALQLGTRIDQLTKPSPVQALTAIAAAVTRQTGPALQAAADFHFKQKADFYRSLPPLSVHVFEDSGGNAASVGHTVELLKSAGVSCDFQAWGIGDNPVKQQALLKAGAQLEEDVNQAILQALTNEGLI